MTALKVKAGSPNIYSEDFMVRSYHVDMHRKLTIPKLCSFFQEIAGNHTVACGVGWEVMQKENMFWVLSRLKIEVDRYPEWQDTITIRTWTNGLDGLMAVRHFQILSDKGEEMIKAISLWLIVNTKTRRLARPFNFMDNFPLCFDRLFDVNPGKLKALIDPVLFEALPVTFTETDMNHHMNNICYIERIINTYDSQFLMENEIHEFEINFLKEALPGDMILVEQQKITDDEFMNAIVRENDSVQMVRTKMKWRVFKVRFAHV